MSEIYPGKCEGRQLASKDPRYLPPLNPPLPPEPEPPPPVLYADELRQAILAPIAQKMGTDAKGSYFVRTPVTVFFDDCGHKRLLFVRSVVVVPYLAAVYDKDTGKRLKGEQPSEVVLYCKTEPLPTVGANHEPKEHPEEPQAAGP